MGVDKIFEAMNRHGCQFMLIGGMNFMLRHQPILTYDVDLWIDDSPTNRDLCEQALQELQVEWGLTDASWGPVANLPRGWLQTQDVYCMTSPHGAIDIFRSVAGLDDWHSCRARAIVESTGGRQQYVGLSDEDMLRCQLALEAGLQKAERIKALSDAIRKQSSP